MTLLRLLLLPQRQRGVIGNTRDLDVSGFTVPLAESVLGLSLPSSVKFFSGRLSLGRHRSVSSLETETLV